MQRQLFGRCSQGRVDGIARVKGGIDDLRLTGGGTKSDGFAQIMTDIQNCHASPMDAARAAQAAGAKSLVLYHLVPPVPVRLIERKFLGDAPGAFDGDLRLANDGMMISLPAGGSSINFSNAF